MVPTARFELATSPLPWDCSTVGAMRAISKQIIKERIIPKE